MIDHRSSNKVNRAPAATTIWTWLALVLLMQHCGLAGAQELEPRAYSNAPVGMKFLVAGAGYSQGGLLFDPAVRIEGANASLTSGLLGYAQVFSIAGKSAKWGIATPFAAMDASGYVSGVFQQRQVTGFADPTLAVSINFFGAPAMSLPEIRRYRQETIIGATLKVTVPVGQYDSDRLINIGTHRWSIKPEIGVSHAFGHWIVEGAAALGWYETNHNFYGGKTITQDLIYSAQGHLIYNHKSGLWAAADATYYIGGQTSTNGVPSDNELSSWRIGLTLAAPLTKYQSIKFSASSGVATRTGTDFDAYLLVWQMRWGAGL
jgi:Putative MetA-pathway of phenol degradation